MGTRGLASVALVLTLVHAVASSLVGQESVPPRNRALVAFADSFIQNPLRYASREAFLDSAQARPDVSITLSPSVIPSVCYGDTITMIRALDHLLLAAYVAGNMRAQLRAGHSGDQPLAGLEAVIDVYHTVRLKVLNYRVPEVEQWVQAQADGTLGQVADSLARHPTEACDQTRLRYGRNAAIDSTPPR